ncbi:RnfABCDGE type electron transport complex subunit D [Enterococcus sp. BWR-S5]|uniref:RnfABCDGE type electron transport complex subunit D n=1 Tax=Enterococcus sp. BWR-S5 TaxID=2787714 RepID=UPI001920E169|nr:RnfABCDGE type electron transport complex subunit D [Enterococcus sp. BWR-S5]MBL1225157.1 RnfABCDGE type electron transport complex subunit D [Enterococcus sp. BWR-S5]
MNQTTEDLTVSVSPHLHSGRTSRSIMLDVIIALLPAIAASGIIFGPRALILIGVTVFSCVASEYVFRRAIKRPQSIYDLTAVVTGILLALNLPVSLPFWMAALGGAIAIIIVKQFFGGVGQNFVNPAITARIVLLMSFASQMNVWKEPFHYLSDTTDIVSSATYFSNAAAGKLPSITDMLLGIRTGSLGETCAIALIIGGIYLIIRKVISPWIPLCFIGTVAVLSMVLGGDPLYQVLSGGLLLGAIFMATDYTTSPINTRGKIIFAVGCGLITVLIRFYASLPEGVSYAILLMNILVPHIETLTIPKVFGEKRGDINETVK